MSTTIKNVTALGKEAAELEMSQIKKDENFKFGSKTWHIFARQ